MKGEQMITKSQRYFNHAFKEWCGLMWEWTVNGESNHPIDSPNIEVVAFYKGFRAAKEGQDAVLKMLSDLRRVQKDFDKIKLELDKFNERDFKES